MATFEKFLTAVSRKASVPLNVTALSHDPFIKYQFTAAEESGPRGRLAKEIIGERVVDYTLYRDEVGYFNPPVYQGIMPIPNTGYCQAAICRVTILPGTSGLTMDNPAFYLQPITTKYAFVPSVYCKNAAALRARLHDMHDIQDDEILQRLQRLIGDHPELAQKIVAYAKTFKRGYDPDAFESVAIESFKTVATGTANSEDD